MEEQVCWKCIGDSILVREIKEKGKPVNAHIARESESALALIG